MRTLVLPLALVLCAAAIAQEAPPAAALPCPKVALTAPDEIKAGEAMKVSASLSGGDPEVTPTYNWSVSAGTVSSGQGTSTITVDTGDVEQDTITVAVEVGGFAPECAVVDSASTMVERPAKPQPPR
ncbi:MAG: hypothetical protein JO197_11050 [Acidobacteria bacterium]|nr:hypothetical protein [Acidobacteriota bacterium]MBV9475716.1 hypothetical protein [Acidobacteriota bacterium]